MRTIICKKCGVEIDASLGVCPNCGAVYYILPEEDKNLEWAMSMDGGNVPPVARPQDSSLHSRDDISRADNDEIFNTRVWKNNDDVDETRAFAAAPPRPQAPPPNPVRQQPVNPYAKRQNSAPPPVPPKKDPNLRKKQLIVAAVALLAVLTIVISSMSGAFDFSNGKDKKFMELVVGMDEAVAKDFLEGKDLEVLPSIYDFNEAASGTVLEQSIKEGKVVKKGDKVTLTVSKGLKEGEPDVVENVKVPTLSGTYDQALQQANIAGLVLTRAEDVYSETVATGVIISQSPAAGTEVKKGDNVIVTVSKGKEPAPSHEISVTAGPGGSVSPSGVAKVDEGKDITFTITPDGGYELRELKVDGVNVGTSLSYTFTKVSGPHSVYAVFQKIQEQPTPPPVVTPSPEPPPVVNSPEIVN